MFVANSDMSHFVASVLFLLALGFA